MDARCAVSRRPPKEALAVARLGPRDAKEAADRLVQAMSKTAHPGVLSNLVPGLSAV